MARHIDVTLGGLHQLLHRIEGKQLADGDWAICGSLVLQLITRMQGKQDRMAAKLAASAGDTAAGTVIDAMPVGPASPPALAAETSTEATQASEVDTPSGAKKKVKGHGRNGSSAFVNAKHVVHALAAGLLGTLCAACGVGRLTRYREKVVIRVVGQPLFAAELHHLEQARCRVCGRIIRALIPDGLMDGVGTSYITYDWSTCAMLIVMHYFAGAPFKRLESLHEGWGVPMPDTNQWDIVDEADNLLLPLHKALEQHAIHKAINFRIDDTGSMVLALAKQIREEIAALKLIGESTKDVRTGINATGVFFETDAGKVLLFYTGRHHAGEIIDQLLRHRKPSPLSLKLVKVTDGASKNFDHQHSHELVEGSCNAHAFLKFRAIKDKYPSEYAIAGEVYKKVFDNDDVAKARSLTSDERMHFHRQHSKPLMLRLKAMCEEKIRDKLVEPNSALWEPLTFIINQWSRLTQFYEAPGVPLDSNLVEQQLIIPVRYLAGSFNYKTETGAEVGDRMMSLVATARANGVEPVNYLTRCLRNHEALAQKPDDYLPWAYRTRIEAREAPARDSPSAACSATSQLTREAV